MPHAADGSRIEQPVSVPRPRSTRPAARAAAFPADQIAYFRLLQTFSFTHLRSIVFDQMMPRIANYWTQPEVVALMQGAGLIDVELFWVNEMSWAARGRKPS